MRIFLSAVSEQFRECRLALQSDLRAIGCEVVVQEDFLMHGHTLLEKLRELVGGCERIIAVVGDAYGYEPDLAGLRPETPRRSYAQWEYFFARGERLFEPAQPGRPVFVYFASRDYLQSHRVQQSPQATQLQQDFIAGIHRSNKDYSQFGSLDQLRAVVLRDGPRGPAPPGEAVRFNGFNAFGPNDAGFFARLLPGGDSGLEPQAIRFWRYYVERDDAMKIGVMSGLSGCGKSSLVKAGLMPKLASHIQPIYVETSADRTESRLLAALRRECRLPENSDLATAISILAEGRALHPGRKKVCIILDQFEQWLHAHQPEDQSLLLRVLDACDGRRLACLLVVRADFFPAIERLREKLGFSLDSEQNYAQVDLLSKDHARKVLMAFGQDPEVNANRNDIPAEFLDRAVEELAKPGAGRVIPVLLALLVEVFKDRPWTTAELEKIGGIDGLGVTFLEGKLSARHAGINIRNHANAAREVLRALLPEDGRSFRGAPVSRENLMRAAGYEQQGGAFRTLLEILEKQLRLITPAEDEEGAGGLYQLTHDHVVRWVQDWLNLKKSKTEILLEERTAHWITGRKEPRYLPSCWEWMRMRLLTKKPSWSDSQREMMRWAARYHRSHTLPWGSMVLLIIAGLVLFAVLKWRDELVATAQSREDAYFHSIALADREWRANHIERARELLDSCPEDLRGWEWRYLNHLFHPAPPTLSHAGPVAAVAFSDDCKMILSIGAAGANNTMVSTWQFLTDANVAADRTRHFTLPGAVNHARFSKDGKRLVVALKDQQLVSIWDVKECKTIWTLQRPEVGAVALSPDGSLVALARKGNADDRAVAQTIIEVFKIADNTTSGHSLVSHCEGISDLAFSPDGMRLACCGTGPIEVWSLMPCPTELLSLPVAQASLFAATSIWAATLPVLFGGHHSRVRAVVFSPDGKEIASAGDDLVVMMWDSTTGKLKRSLFGQESAILALAIYSAPQKKALGAAGEDQTAMVWNAETGERLSTFRDHRYALTSVAFAADGFWLVSGSMDGSVKVWKLSSGQGPETYSLLNNKPCTALAFLQRPAIVELASAFEPTIPYGPRKGESVHIWQLHKGRRLPLYYVPGERCVAFSVKGFLATATNGEILTWDAKEQSMDPEELPGPRMQAGPGPVRLLVYSQDGDQLAWAGEPDGTVRVWNVSAVHAPIALRGGHSMAVTGVAFLPDGRLVSGSLDGSVCAWGADGQPRPLPRPERSLPVRHLAISSTGRWLAAACGDDEGRIGQIVIWDIASRESPLSIQQDHPVRCVAFSPEHVGHLRLASASDDRTVKLWDLRRNPPRQVLTLDESAWPMTAVLFSKDGKLLATGSSRGTIRVYEAPP